VPSSAGPGAGRLIRDFSFRAAVAVDGKTPLDVVGRPCESGRQLMKPIIEIADDLFVSAQRLVRKGQITFCSLTEPGRI
jgi:hypothetical protein